MGAGDSSVGLAASEGTFSVSTPELLAEQATEEGGGREWSPVAFVASVASIGHAGLLLVVGLTTGLLAVAGLEVEVRAKVAGVDAQEVLVDEVADCSDRCFLFLLLLDLSLDLSRFRVSACSNPTEA